MGRILISPSILSADFGDIGAVVKELENCGADSIHLDVMDGHFVPPITFGSAMISSLRSRTKIPFEVHLMTQNPETYFDDFVRAGANALIVHIEAIKDPRKTLELIRSLGVKSGIAIDKGTSFEAVKNYLKYADILLIMSVKAGYGGQKFVPESLVEIKKARKYIDGERLKTLIEVDGGINIETAKEAISAGINELVAGTAITSSKNIKKSIMDFKNL